jgi:ParB family transcriptional regulator, chromosome partitioning protein
MELEFHQLDRRYEQLRTSCRRRDSRVLASLDRHGQQLPVIVVVGVDGRYVLVDGYKRVRGLHKLGRDTVRAICWDLPEADALLLGRLMQTAEGDSALEQGWLLRELRDRFELTTEELARRFDRSASWVSTRLGLVGELPEAIQAEVREGRLAPHAAMKFLLPLARANRAGAIELAAAIAPLRPSTRQTEALCVAYARAGAEGRRHLLSEPELFLRAREGGGASLPAGPGELLQHDLGALGGIARRGTERIEAGAVRDLLPPERSELSRRAAAIRDDVDHLFDHLKREIEHAGRADTDDHSEAP